MENAESFQRRSSVCDILASRAHRVGGSVFYLGPNNPLVAQLSHRSHSLGFTISYFWSFELLNQPVFWNYSLGLIDADEWVRLQASGNRTINGLLRKIPIVIIAFRKTSLPYTRQGLKVLDGNKGSEYIVAKVVHLLSAIERTKMATGA